MLRNVRNALFPHDIAQENWGSCIFIVYRKIIQILTALTSNLYQRSDSQFFSGHPVHVNVDVLTSGFKNKQTDILSQVHFIDVTKILWTYVSPITVRVHTSLVKNSFDICSKNKNDLKAVTYRFPSSRTMVNTMLYLFLDTKPRTHNEL